MTKPDCVCGHLYVSHRADGCKATVEAAPPFVLPRLCSCKEYKEEKAS